MFEDIDGKGGISKVIR